MSFSELRTWPAFEIEESPQFYNVLDRDYGIIVDRYPKSQRKAAEQMVAFLNDRPEEVRYAYEEDPLFDE